MRWIARKYNRQFLSEQTNAKRLEKAGQKGENLQATHKLKKIPQCYIRSEAKVSFNDSLLTLKQPRHILTNNHCSRNVGEKQMGWQDPDLTCGVRKTAIPHSDTLRKCIADNSL